MEAPLQEINPEDEYDMLGEFEHILRRPDMYVGSTTLETKMMSLVEFLPDNNFRIVDREVRYVEGLERAYIEILSNAADNAKRSREMGIPVGKIDIRVTSKTVSIYNEGRAISHQWHSKYDMWIPHMIFFNLRAGSSFNDNMDRKYAGRNGLGAKLCGILSTSFEIDLANTREGMTHKQAALDNFATITDPVRTEIPATPNSYEGSYTKVTWSPDFMRFYCNAVASNVHNPPTSTPITTDPYHCRVCWKQNKGRKPAFREEEEGEDVAVFMDDFVGIMARLALDFAFNCNVPINFTYDPEEDDDSKVSILFNINTPLDFAKAYMPELVNIASPPIIYESGDGDTRMVMLDTPYNGRAVSFANGMPTRLGGVHVNSWINGIAEELKEQLTKKSVINIGVADIRRHVTIFLSVYVPNPEFDGQTKERLKGPKPKVEIRDTDVKTFMQWNAVGAIRSGMEKRELSKIARTTDGKKRKFVSIKNADDAELAGSAEAYRCQAFLVEGASAKSFWEKGLKYVRDSRKIYGCYPMRGKVLNTRKADTVRIIDNKVLNDIKEFVGLRENMDYNVDRNRSTLRYGKIIILTDADVDGIHIKGLLINYFSRYKGLIEQGCVIALLTPVITLSRGPRRLSMYSISEYDKWINITGDHEKWQTSYFKGLGSATDQMIKDAFTNPVKQVFECSPEDKEVLDMAFGSLQADVRKNLYRMLVDLKPADRMNSQQISKVEDMVYEELILYAVTANKRQIPKMTDGLKDVQGKIIYAAMKDSGSWDGVEEFQGYTKKLTKYHHGPDPLKGAIITMGQNFPRSNNIPFIEGRGNFGSRIGLGSKASPARYLSCRPSKIIDYMFREEDKVLLIPEMEDGKQTGYKYFLPILPPHLINRGEGVGWGWAHKSVQYNPFDLIEWVRYFVQHIKDGKPNSKFKPPSLLPWWRNYTGVMFRRKDGKAVNRGYFKEQGAYCYVTELPADTSSLSYKEQLDKMILAEKISEYYAIGVDPDEPEFKIGGYKECFKTHKQWHIEKVIVETSMTFLDEHDVPQTYFHGPQEVMASWCKWRYKKYVERKKVYIPKLEEDMRLISLKMAFVEDVIAEPPRLEFRNKPKDSYMPYMHEKGYPESFLNMSVKTFTREKVEKLRTELGDKAAEIEIYKNMHPGDLWIKDLMELKGKLQEMFPDQWYPVRGYGTKRQEQPPRQKYV